MGLLLSITYDAGKCVITDSNVGQLLNCLIDVGLGGTWLASFLFFAVLFFIMAHWKFPLELMLTFGFAISIVLLAVSSENNVIVTAMLVLFAILIAGYLVLNISKFINSNQT